MQQLTVFRFYCTAFLATICLFFIYWFLNHHFNGTVWNSLQMSHSGLTGEYCELTNTKNLFYQNSNTYSNLVYFFLGIIVLQIAIFDFKNKKSASQNIIQQFPLISFFFGICLIYLCFASTFFHASLSYIGERADMNATYSIAITLIGISSYRFFVKQDKSTPFKISYVLFLFFMILIFIEIYLYISSFVLLPFLLFIVTVFTIINYIKNKERFNVYLQILSLLLMVGAFILRTLDVYKVGCNPLSVYQGHSVWHFFTGMSAFILYWFYRNEQTITQ